MGSSSSSYSSVSVEKTAVSTSMVDSKEIKNLEKQLEWLKEMKDDFADPTEIEGLEIQNDTNKEISNLQDKYEIYKENPTLDSFLETVSAHVSLVTKSSVNGFENSMKQCGTFKKLIKILEETDIIGDEKYGDIMKRLFSLYYLEWKLLEKTSISMQLLSNKASETRLIIDIWKDKISNNEKLTKEQLNIIINTLEKWFNEEEYITKLHEEWSKFVEKANLFKQEFNSVSNNISQIITRKLREKCEKLLPNRPSLLGVGAGVIGIGIVKAVCVVGAIAVTSTFWTGLLITGAVVAGIGVVAGIVYAGKLAYKKYKDNKEINKAIKDEENFGSQIMNDLNDMVNTAGKIRQSLHELTKLMKQQCGQSSDKSKFELLIPFILENEKIKKQSIEILKTISNSLDKFELKCKEIENLAIERQSKFI